MTAPDPAYKAANLIRPLTATIEGCAIDGGYEPGWQTRDLAEQIADMLADAGLLLADHADRDELRSQLRRARQDRDDERAAKEGNWKALGEWSARAERAEAEVDELQGRLSELLDNLTGGRMSKTNYDVRTMVQEVEAYFERAVDDEVAELRATVAARDALIRDLADPGECWFDHNGGCQEHGYLSLEPGQTCPQYDAQQIVAALDGAGEPE